MIDTKDWLEVIDDILIKGLESTGDSDLDIYVEGLEDDEMIIRFNDIENTKFLIKRI